MRSSADARRRFSAAFESRGLEVISLNANGNPLHPTQPQQGECLKDTIRVAGELGIKTVCTMSGLPAGREGDLMPNWVVSSWPPETQAILKYQWEEKLLPFWSDIADLARASGVERIALELHGNQCVYNAPSLLKLRAAIGPAIGANLDPSHLFWMGADPLAAAEARLADWRFRPNGTEGFAKAEVTVGGIATAGLSSKTMEARTTPGLYAIGEAVDVTGWLGGYNFQWAWASGHAAGQAIAARVAV